MTVRAVRGTRDLLPEVTPRWQQLEEQARRLAHHFGFQEIRTPLFEKAELFVRGMGVLAGLVERELWTFHDKFGQKLALRADGTAAVVRAYYEHGLKDSHAGIHKLYYLAPVFLIGRESEEGSRQCHQFGVEALGSADAAVDAEVMSLAWALFKKLGLTNVRFEVNTLGCDKCRPAYHDALKDYYGAHSSELCATCKRKHKTHPLWTLGCPERQCKELSQVAPTMFGLLCPACKSHFNQLKACLTEVGLPYDLNPRVVRDLEYYNRTIFQVVHQGQVLGTGGRYDGLVETLGGPDTPAVGFALHLEAVLDALGPASEEACAVPAVVFLPEGEESTRMVLPALNRLREAGVFAEIQYPGDRNGSLSEEGGTRFVVMVAEKDVARGQGQLHDRRNDHKDRMPLNDLIMRIASRLGVSSAVAPVERARSNEPTRGEPRGRRRNGALRGRHFNVEADLEMHYDAEPAASAQSAAGESRSSRRRRRRRRGGEEESLPASPTRETADERPAEERSVRSRRQRGRRGSSDRESPRESAPEPAYDHDRYEERYDRARSGRGGRSESSPSACYEDDRDRDYPREASYEAADDDYERPVRRDDYEEDYPESRPSRQDDDYERETQDSHSSGRGRRGRGGGEERYDSDYEREEPARSSRRSYEDYDDDGPQPVDSKLALLESSRAASRYRSSRGDEGRSRRAGGGGRSGASSGGSRSSGGGSQSSRSSSGGARGSSGRSDSGRTGGGSSQSGSSTGSSSSSSRRRRSRRGGGA